MNTLEKAAYYSAVLKKNFGVDVPESLDLASMLDDLVAEIEALHAHRHTREDVISDCKCALENALDSLTTVYGISAEAPITREIQENLK